MKTLLECVATFARAYEASDTLKDHQRGWTRTIALVASDTGESVAVRIDEGRIAGWEPGSTGDVVITSDASTLADILELRRGPNEPYLFGELTVRGPEADFLRLDYVSDVLCPR